MSGKPKGKWERDMEERARIKPEQVAEDLKIVEQLALRARNRFEHDNLYACFGLLAGSQALRSFVPYVIGDSDKFTRTNDFTAMQILQRLEPLAIAGRTFFYEKEDKTPGCWGGMRGFLERANVVSERFFGNDLDASILRTAYKKEGRSADLEGVSDLCKVVRRSYDHKLVIPALMGRDPIVPYCEDENTVIRDIDGKIQNGLRTHRCDETAKLLSVLLDSNAPVELWRTARKAIERQMRLGGKFDSWMPDVSLMIRYSAGSEQEKEFIRTHVEADRLWEEGAQMQYQFNRTGRLRAPKFYELLTEQIKRGMEMRQIASLIGVLGNIEEHPEAISNLGIALTGRRASLDEIVENLRGRSIDFLGSDSGSQYPRSEKTSLPALVELSGKRPPKKIMPYLHLALKSGSAFSDINLIADSHPHEYKKANSGARSNYVSSCVGSRFARNRREHQPRAVEVRGDVIERGAGALNVLYNELSGLEHQAVVGSVDVDDKNCRTAAFVNQDAGVIHAVFTNSMMFDPNVTEENCGRCPSLTMCRGMEEYTSVVLFDPKKFDKEFLTALQETIPGSFELHRNQKGLYRVSNFSVFPEKMSLVYYNPIVTRRSTPINTGVPIQTMVVFPHNINGSAYLANSLRSGNINLQTADWPSNEAAVLIDGDVVEKEGHREFSDTARTKLAHLGGREIKFAGAHRDAPMVYHPSVSFTELTRDVTWSSRNLSGESYIVSPVYQRRIVR